MEPIRGSTDAAFDRFVTGLYHDFLHRAPQPTEVAAWVASLGSGRSRARVAQEFASSTEYRSALISDNYRNFLGRPPAPEELRTWLRALELGLDTRQVQVKFLAAGEYYADHGSDASGWLTGLYRDVLHRAPDPAGAASWGQVLQQGIPLEVVATAVVSSTEANARTVTTAYQRLFGRYPDAGGLTSFGSVLAQGLTPLQLDVILAGSPEYFVKESGTVSPASVGPDPLPQDDHGDMCDAHPNYPIKRDEHCAVMDLVMNQDATMVAVQSGTWSDPATWSDGAVLGRKARVIIPTGLTVTVDGMYDRDGLDWLRVDGVLRFAPNANTSLKVTTTVVNTMGEVDIGTEAEPIHADRSAHLIVGDRGVRDQAMRLYDPYDFTGGFISHGRVRIFGTPHASQAAPLAVPHAGDSQLVFASRPMEWQVGDILLFAGLDGGTFDRARQTQDEQRGIAAISPDGLIFTLTRPLSYQHCGIYGYPGPVPVGNLTRNVVFTSENTTDLSRRGHTMFMHNQDVIIDSARFYELGRTDALHESTDPKIIDGLPQPGTDTNTRGRYAVHFHIRSGARYSQTPGVVRNSSVQGSPKFCIVNHGGYVQVDDNVTYLCNGAHLFGENGSEIGRFEHNLMVRSFGSPDAFDSRQNPYTGHDDYGFTGNGVWLQGGGIDVVNNIAIGQSGAAFAFGPKNVPDSTADPTFVPQQEPELDYVTPYPLSLFAPFPVFLTENLRDPSIAQGAPWIDPRRVPGYFVQDVGLASGAGMNVWFDKEALIEECLFAKNDDGMDAYFARNTILRNVQFFTDNPSAGDGIDSDVETASMCLENVTIAAYETSYRAPTLGDNIVQGGFMDGLHKIIVGDVPMRGGSLRIDGITWGHTPGEDPYKISFSNDYAKLDGVKFVPGFLAPLQITYNGQHIYLESQRPESVPLDNDVFRPLAHLTNQQLWDQYRLAMGGRLAPASAHAEADIAGALVSDEDVPF